MWNNHDIHKYKWDYIQTCGKITLNYTLKIDLRPKYGVWEMFAWPPVKQTYRRGRKVHVKYSVPTFDPRRSPLRVVLRSEYRFWSTELHRIHLGSLYWSIMSRKQQQQQHEEPYEERVWSSSSLPRLYSNTEFATWPHQQPHILTS